MRTVFLCDCLGHTKAQMTLSLSNRELYCFVNVTGGCESVFSAQWAKGGVNNLSYLSMVVFVF